MKKFIEDFKAFALKGNVVDMAIGVIIGGAFGKIVTSLVNDIIMPLISLITGNVNFTELKWVFKEALLDKAGNVITPEAALTYGNFIQTVVDFLIISLSIFLVLKMLLKAKEKAENLKNKQVEETAEEVKPDENIVLLTEIRDLLKNK